MFLFRVTYKLMSLLNILDKVKYYTFRLLSRSLVIMSIYTFIKMSDGLVTTVWHLLIMQLL